MIDAIDVTGPECEGRDATWQRFSGNDGNVRSFAFSVAYEIQPLGSCVL